MRADPQRPHRPARTPPYRAALPARLAPQSAGDARRSGPPDLGQRGRHRCRHGHQHLHPENPCRARRDAGSAPLHRNYPGPRLPLYRTHRTSRTFAARYRDHRRAGVRQSHRLGRKRLHRRRFYRGNDLRPRPGRAGAHPGDRPPLGDGASRQRARPVRHRRKTRRGPFAGKRHPRRGPAASRHHQTDPRAKPGPDLDRRL